MKSNSLQLNGLVIAREGAAVLPPIHEQIISGEVLVVRGPNGSGKSSLLKTVAGLLPPASGHVAWNGAPMTESADYPRNVVYLGHKRGVDTSLSVGHHVRFWANAFGQAELIGAALHYFDLEDIANVPVHTLSAGWQQRVALTRLITQPGSLWLLDEPAANLDEAGVLLLNSLMETRCQQGGMVMLATHSLAEGPKVRTIELQALAPQMEFAA